VDALKPYGIAGDFLGPTGSNIIVEVIDLYGKEKIKKHESLVVLNGRAKA